MEEKWGLFQKFLITESEQISLGNFLINTAIILFLAIILEFTYRKCAKTLSNRYLFAANFFLISFTTMLIISIVKSSLALSLGLVGALSIVRFRSAIKEPEELVYLFLSIAIGLGMGANQRIVIISAFFVITAIIWVRSYFSRKSESQNFVFSITTAKPKSLEIHKLTHTLKQFFPFVTIQRYDQNKDYLEISFLVEVNKYENLQLCRNHIENIDDEISISIVDNKTY